MGRMQKLTLIPASTAFGTISPVISEGIGRFELKTVYFRTAGNFLYSKNYKSTK